MAIVRNGLVGATRPWTKRTLKGQLKRWLLPAWWIALCVAAAASVEKAPLVVGLELFSGKGELTRAFNDYSGDFLSFELADDEEQNALELSGVKLILKRLFRIKRGGCHKSIIDCLGFVLGCPPFGCHLGCLLGCPFGCHIF